MVTLGQNCIAEGIRWTLYTVYPGTPTRHCQFSSVAVSMFLLI